MMQRDDYGAPIPTHAVNQNIAAAQGERHLYQKTGGFMKGICHPTGNPALLREAGIGWVRMDAPYPTDEGYGPFVKRVAEYLRQGIRTIVISPYPSRFIQSGIDPATPEGLLQVEAVCARMAADFAVYQPCWQASNEMHIGHFRAPLNEMQAVDFLAASIRGLKRGDPNAAVGHNSVEDDWLEKADLVARRAGGVDYIGLDLYAGTWMEGNSDTYLSAIERLHERLKSPIVLMEFGFAAAGDCMASDFSDVVQFLRNRGFYGIEDAIARLDDLTEQLPPRLSRVAKTAPPEERFSVVRGFIPHLMKKWPCAGAFPHKEEGQAAFYADLLPKLLSHPHLAGAVIYCMRDSERCFLCGEADCPTETAWGLLRLDGTKKPAYHVVKQYFEQYTKGNLQK